MGELFDSEDH